MKRHSESKPDARQAGAKIPDKPRDCGPHVDTWPILDTERSDAPKPADDKGSNPRPRPSA
jgi:hypothetical protein